MRYTIIFDTKVRNFTSEKINIKYNRGEIAYKNIKFLFFAE